MTQAVQSEYLSFLAIVICPGKKPDPSIAFSKICYVNSGRERLSFLLDIEYAMVFLTHRGI